MKKVHTRNEPVKVVMLEIPVIARLIVDALLEKNQKLAVKVLKGIIYYIKKKELLKYAANLEDMSAFQKL